MSKDWKFWARVRARQEAYCEAIKIKRTRRQIIAAVPPPPPGSPPFVFRQAFEAAGCRLVSRAELEEARLLFLRREAPRKADAPYYTSEEFAVGICQLELHHARQKLFSRRVISAPAAKDARARHLIDSGTATSDCDNGVAASFGPWRPGALPHSPEEWNSRGHSVKALPDDLLLLLDARGVLERVLEKSPGRKRGRPPNGARAMSSAERSRKHRAKEPGEK